MNEKLVIIILITILIFFILNKKFEDFKKIEDFENNKEKYKKYYIIDNNNNEYSLISYTQLSFENKQRFLNNIKNNKININSKLFSIDTLQQSINDKYNNAMTNDIIFAVKTSFSNIIFNYNEVPYYKTDENIKNTIMFNNEHAKLYINSYENKNTLLFTLPNIPFNLENNNIFNKANIYENNTINNLNIDLINIYDNLFFINLTSSPTNYKIFGKPYLIN